jgi:hypothetical protein
MPSPRTLFARVAALLCAAAALSSAACKDEVEPGPVVVPGHDLAPSHYTLSVVASPSAAQAGQEVVFTTTLLDWNGTDVSAEHDIRTEISPPLGVLADGGGQYRFTRVDTYSYFASVDVADATIVAAATVEVGPGPAAVIDVHAELPMAEAGTPNPMIAEISDAFGNPATGEVTWTVEPTASISGNEVTATHAGDYVVTGHLDGTSAEDSDGFTVVAGEPASLDISLSSYDVERGQGVIVTTDVRDEWGNPSDFPVELSTSGAGTEAWATFIRFHDEGIFTVYADIVEYGLHDEDGPVLVDSSGPQIRVTTPDRGQEIPSATNPTVLVTGSVTDPWTGVVSVTINGEPATLMAGGLFEYSMAPEQGLNGIELVATDGDGNVSDHYQTFLWGEFLPAGNPNEDGILARLNEGAIDTIEGMAEDLFDGNALTSSIVGLPLWSNSQQTCFGWPIGCVTWWNLTAGVSAATLGDLDIDLDARTGYLDFYGSVSPFSISLGVWGNIFLIGSVSVGGTAAANSAQIWSDVYLSVDSNNEIQVSMANTDVALPGFNLSIYGAGFVGDLLNAVLGWLSPVLQAAFEAVLPPVIESQLPGLIEDALADIEIATEIDLLGVPLTVGALPQDIDIDEDGMTIALESTVTAPAAVGAPATLGSFRRSDYSLPAYGLSPDFSISLADNFTNQLLHQVWQAGVMDLSMDATGLGLDLTSLSTFFPLTSIEFETEPLLPPIVGPSPSGELMELSVGDMLVNVWGDPGGNYGLMMQLAVAVSAEADLSIDTDGLIQFEIGEPVIVMDYVTSDWTELDGETAENLMDAIVDLIVPAAVGTLDELGGIPLPELPGFALGSPSIGREPAPAFYITAEGNLTPAP